MIFDAKFQDEVSVAVNNFKSSWYKPSYYSSIIKWHFTEIKSKGVKECTRFTLTKIANIIASVLKGTYEMTRLDYQNSKSVQIAHFNEEKLEDSRKLYDEALQDLPKAQRWRLFIDSDKHILNDENIFDVNEPGYKRAMMNAFNTIRDSLGVRMDAKKFVKLHDTCINNVKRERGRNIPPQAFLKGNMIGCRYGFSWEMTDFGIKEILKEWKTERLIYWDKYNNDDRREYLASLLYSQKRKVYKVISHYSGVNDFRVDALFNVYYKEIDRSISTIEKLLVIVQLCRALEILHVFPDGNQRTIVFSLLTKLLIENGFCPTILEDPAIFDGAFCLDQLVEQVINGMVTYFKNSIEFNNLPKSLSPGGTFNWMLSDKFLLENDLWKAFVRRLY